MENRETKLLLGKILGEIYRLQKQSGLIPPLGDAHTFALLNGFESEINSALDNIGFVSESDFEKMGEILEKIYEDVERVEKFKGYYDLEKDLKAAGIDRPTAIRILKYMKADDQFVNLIDKMDSSQSPIECRKFDLGEWDH